MLTVLKVDHFYVVTVVKRDAKSEDEQQEETSWAVDLFHL